MKAIEKRLEVLEAQGARPITPDDQEDELLLMIIKAHYTGVEPQLTPEQEQMLRDTEKWFQDEGLWDLYFGPRGP